MVCIFTENNNSCFYTTVVNKNTTIHRNAIKKDEKSRLEDLGCEIDTIREEIKLLPYFTKPNYLIVKENQLKIFFEIYQNDKEFIKELFESLSLDNQKYMFENTHNLELKNIFFESIITRFNNFSK